MFKIVKRKRFNTHKCTHRVGSNVLPLQQNLLPRNPRRETILERKFLGLSPLSPGIHPAFGPVGIGGHGRMIASEHVVGNVMKLVALEFHGIRARSRIGIVHDTRANLHVAVMMRIQVAVDRDQAALHVRRHSVLDLGDPGHGVAVLVEPGGGFVIVRGGFAAYAVVGVETVVTIFAGGTSGRADAFAVAYDVVGVPVTGTGSLQCNGDTIFSETREGGE